MATFAAASTFCLCALVSGVLAVALPAFRYAAVPASLGAMFVSSALNLFWIFARRREKKDRAEAEARRERLLADALERADSSDKARRAIIMNMTHEFRTPLNSVIGFAELLAEGETNPERIEMARCVQRGGWQMLDMVNSVIRAAELSSSTTRKPVATKFTLNGLLENVAAAHEYEAKRKGIAVRAKAVDDRVVIGCMDSIVALLGLLISNGIKYSEAGTAVELRCRELPVSGFAGVTYEFAVADQGKGMDKATVNRLFRPFEQGEDPLIKRHGGMGVGLYSAKRLAESLSGDLMIESEEGVGTTAYLIVPLETDQEKKGVAS